MMGDEVRHCTFEACDKRREPCPSSRLYSKTASFVRSGRSSLPRGARYASKFLRQKATKHYRNGRRQKKPTSIACMKSCPSVMMAANRMLQPGMMSTSHEDRVSRYRGPSRG